MIAGNFYYYMLTFFILGGLSTFLTEKSPRITNYLAHSMALLGSLSAVLCAIFVFWQGGIYLSFSSGLPFGALSVTVDNLSAFFLLVIGLAGSLASVYAMGYSLEYYKRRLPIMAGLYNIFLFSMVMVVSVSHVLAFLISWEIMSVVSFFLVNHEYEKKANQRAAFIYIVMTHVGTVFVIAAFLLLSTVAGSMEFASLHDCLYSQRIKDLAFICAFIGFGTKAGIIPLHIWLPRAHPAAPSHVSALMSGVMLKTAIYGLCRFFLDFLGTGPAWWGGVVLLFAAATAVLGALYAFIEHDIKRLLAYSTVENMGIILLGIGAGMVMMNQGYPVLAGIAWCAALYHLFNHAIFKSLMFMGAGAVLSACHTKNMEQLGGLIKKMPYTALFTLIGSIAISALPPFNGFVSEWMVFQSLFILPQVLPGLLGKVVGALLIALLGLTGALAAACFVEAFGITFLAKPRSRRAEMAEEVPISIRIAMGGAAVLCLVLGVWPQGMLALLEKIFVHYQRVDISGLQVNEWYQFAWKYQHSGAVFSPAELMTFLLAGLLAAFLLHHLYGREKIVAGETWTCGIIPEARMEYTATGFSKSIRRVFSTIAHPQYESLVDNTANRYHGRTLFYNVRIIYLFSSMLYKPVNAKILRLARLMKNIQTGSVQLYVGYIMAVTVVILLLSTRW